MDPKAFENMKQQFPRFRQEDKGVPRKLTGLLTIDTPDKLEYASFMHKLGVKAIFWDASVTGA